MNLSDKQKKEREELFDAVEYALNQIELILALKSDDPIRLGSFRGAYMISKHLSELIKLGAIVEERELVGTPLIMIKDKNVRD